MTHPFQLTPYSLSVRDRIMAWYGGTVLVVLGLVLALVHVRVNAETNRHVAAQMNTTRRVVMSLQHERAATLETVARLAGEEPRLAGVMTSGPGDDPETVSAKNDPATVGDLLRDLNRSFKTDFMRVTDAHGLVLADTSGRFNPHTDLSANAAVKDALSGKASSHVRVSPQEIDLAATAPIHVGGQDLGIVTVGRRVSEELAAQLHQDTGSQVTFFAGAELAASSWPPQQRQELVAALRSVPEIVPAADGSRSFAMTMGGQRLMCLMIPVFGDDGTRGLLLIQSSLDEALQPYTNIQRALAVVGLIGLLVAVMGSAIVAGGVTGPLRRITGVAYGLMQGDWSQRAPISSRDEVGLLAETFNRMAERLESWDSDMRAAVDERTRELNDTLARLDAAYQLMRQFNADASHELRTPLTVIRGEAEVALRAARSPAEYQSALRSIEEETERMSRIIEQLLMLARADSGELRLARQPVAFDDLVREVAHRAQVLAFARRIRLHTEILEPTLMEGDEDRLRQLVLNLIDNAIKYTPEGGEVRVRLSSVPGGGGRGTQGVSEDGQSAPGEPHASSDALLEVEDTGIGIDAEDLPYIFDRFYRVDKARSRAQGGSGLGLAICRWIVEAHGGRIDVRSRPGIGSTFAVRLPGAAAPAFDGSLPEFVEA